MHCTTMDRIDDGDALNLSTGIYTSFKQFARIAAEECGYFPEVQGLSDKPAAVFSRGGDTSKQAACGFVNQTSFREGIRQVLAYLEKGALKQIAMRSQSRWHDSLVIHSDCFLRICQLSEPSYRL